jgi:hypothetical protein
MVKKWVLPTTEGKWELQDFGEAYFHMFAQGGEEVTDGVLNNPVAIVEYKKTGEVDTVHPNQITFIGAEE